MENSTAKPICLVYYYQEHSSYPPYKLMDDLQRMMPDYHVLVVPSRKPQEYMIDIRVIWKKDWSEEHIEQFKSKVLQILKEKTGANASS